MQEGSRFSTSSPVFICRLFDDGCSYWPWFLKHPRPSWFSSLVVNCFLFSFSHSSQPLPVRLPQDLKVKVLVAQLCLTLCDPMDCSLPGFTVHEILQARILEWVAISFSMVPSEPSDWTWVSSIVGRFFTIWTTRKAPQGLVHFLCYTELPHPPLQTQGISCMATALNIIPTWRTF